MSIPFDKPENLSTTFDKALESDKPTNPTDDSITTVYNSKNVLSTGYRT